MGVHTGQDGAQLAIGGEVSGRGRSMAQLRDLGARDQSGPVVEPRLDGRGSGGIAERSGGGDTLVDNVAGGVPRAEPAKD